MLAELIDKQDTFEIVRDQIAAILLLETKNQQALASAADRNPDEWAFRVFTERLRPWEQMLDVGGAEFVAPIVNVWYDSSTFPQDKGDTFERQNSQTIFNIDCYGYGRAADNPQGGHEPGDLRSAESAQRAFRLVRNILMANENRYLGLQGTVWGRWPQSVNSMQPEQPQEVAVQNVAAIRLALLVSFNEFSPQAEPAVLELLSVDVLRTEDGEIVLEADYSYPIT